MALTTDLRDLIPLLSRHVNEPIVVCEQDEVTAVRSFESELSALGDERLLLAKSQMLAVNQVWQQMMQSMTGLVVARSHPEFGHGGLAAKQGHRSAVSMVQEDLGVSKAEASRIVRVAGAVTEVSGAAARPDSATTDLERERQAIAEAEARAQAEAEAQARAEGNGDDAAAGNDAGDDPERCLHMPWNEPLKAANRAMKLSGAQFHAIMTGLGEPPQTRRDMNGDPVGEEGLPLLIDDSGVIASAADADAFDQAAREAWRQAARDLIAEAQVRTVSDLLAHARSVRDELDPAGAAARFAERYEARSFRMYQLDNGATRATWTMDDMTALSISAAIDAAMRPRSGGPRFVDSAEKEAAKALRDDPRTNDQLVHDLVADIFRAGLLADAEAVFGTRQAGVRLVQVVDAHGKRSAVAHSEDRLTVVPGAVADQHVCNTETTPITIDAAGNPLQLGRTTRLFTAKQRLALAIRDGGCRWMNCDRPASYCEAHHIDPWEQGGHTNVDRGILLCQYHHLTLHNNHWRIIKNGDDDFVLTHPDHPPQVLPVRAPLKYAWAQTPPQPRRFLPADPPPRAHALASIH